jgi:hypothetical protein
MEAITPTSIPVRKQQSPLYEALVKLNAGDYIDIQEEDKSTGNFLSAKIGMWKKHNKLSGTFSRRKVGNGIIRVFRVI